MIITSSFLKESLLKEITFSFIHSSGPGGQNVNKVATAVQLRFDVARSRVLTEETRMRLTRLAGHRISEQGILIIEAKRYRSQEKNKEDAFKRLLSLIELSEMPLKKRKRTRPSKSSIEKRLTQKRQHSQAKSTRHYKQKSNEHD